MTKDEEFKVGDPAPNFWLQDPSGQKFFLKDFLGKWIVLYFYPKDNTYACTMEAVEFSRKLPKFKQIDALVIGISPDSCESHQNFLNKHHLKILLLCDAEHEAIKKYHAWKMSKMYGRDFISVDRSTFIIDPLGNICYVWRNVKVQGHISEVFKRLKKLQRNRPWPPRDTDQDTSDS